MASLVIQTGARRGQVIPLQKPVLRLGRLADNDVVLDESMLRPGTRRPQDAVSRRHAVLTRAEGDYWIVDGDGNGRPSSNGTFVNRQRIPATAPSRLRDQDRIQMCGFTCTFQHDEADAVAVEASASPDSSVVSLDSHSGERLRLLLQITNDLSHTVHQGTILERVLDSLVQLFPQADRALVLLCDGPEGRPVVRASRHRRADDPAADRFSGSVVRHVLHRMEAILGEDLAGQLGESSSIPTLPPSSLMCAPLWSPSNQPLGALQIETRDARARFTREDLGLFLGVAGQASVAVSNARLHAEALENQRRLQDLETARQVQRALLPAIRLQLPGYDFHAIYEPAGEVGGDHYDYLPLPGGRLAVLQSDAAGKGAAASLVSIKFSVEARAALLAEADLGTALGRLNELMARTIVCDRFVTLAAAVLDPAAHAVTVASAGHPTPLVVRAATGEVEETVPRELGGPPLGVTEEWSYGARTVALGPGDGLVLYSDGVSEARNREGRLFQVAGAAGALRGRAFAPRAGSERLLQAVRAYAEGGEQSDDITIVGLARLA